MRAREDRLKGRGHPLFDAAVPGHGKKQRGQIELHGKGIPRLGAQHNQGGGIGIRHGAPRVQATYGAERAPDGLAMRKGGPGQRAESVDRRAAQLSLTRYLKRQAGQGLTEQVKQPDDE